jgi:hypothetical protein
VSSSNSITYYDINAQIGNPNQQDSLGFRLTSASGITDAVALDLATAISGLDLPPGITVTVSLVKYAENTTTSLGDLASTPAVFL